MLRQSLHCLYMKHLDDDGQCVPRQRRRRPPHGPGRASCS